MTDDPLSVRRIDPEPDGSDDLNDPTGKHRIQEVKENCCDRVDPSYEKDISPPTTPITRWHGSQI